MSLLATQSAHREYASRPADERLGSLEALVSTATDDRNRSIERTYNLKDLRAVPTDAGSVHLASPKGEARLTHWSFGQLARTIGAPAGYLRDLPATLASDCINYGLTEAVPGTSCNLLVRTPSATDSVPTIRAATSETYGRVWDADLYGGIQQQLARWDDRWTLPPTWSGEPAGAYRGDRDSFLILTNGGSIVTDPSLTNRGPGSGTGTGGGTAPRDSMFRGILVRNSEVGAASVVIERILFRYICGNHMLWSAMADRSFRRRHVGVTALRDTVREISRLAYEWGQASTARDTAIIRALVDHEIAHTKEAVIDELRALGATKDQATAAYELCEKQESVSPRSFWGAAQGLTRLSQAGGYQDERYSMDRIAASLLAKGAKVYA